jgi:hypothetical protein
VETRLNTDLRLSGAAWEAMAAMVLLRPHGGIGNGMCERCGQHRATDPHHRWLKSQGGPDVPGNLACLCRKDHDWCHAHPAEAAAEGWIVQAPYDFRGTPVRLWNGILTRLTDDYGYDILEWAT